MSLNGGCRTDRINSFLPHRSQCGAVSCYRYANLNVKKDFPFTQILDHQKMLKSRPSVEPVGKIKLFSRLIRCCFVCPYSMLNLNLCCGFLCVCHGCMRKSWHHFFFKLCSYFLFAQACLKTHLAVCFVC